MRRRLLVTGAAGNVGQAVLDDLEERYDVQLTDVRRPARVGRREFQVVDVTDSEAVRAAVRDVDTVLHLAVKDLQFPWSELLPVNIAGTYNVLQAAAAGGVRRVVFTSSSQVVEGCSAAPVGANLAPCPSNLYGASKAAGEALACSFVAQTGLSVICLRLGFVLAAADVGSERDSHQLEMVITHRDLARLLVAAIEAPTEWRFKIFNGLSDNRVKRLDIGETRRQLGYEPQDDAFALAGRVVPGRTVMALRRARRSATRLLRRAVR